MQMFFMAVGHDRNIHSVLIIVFMIEVGVNFCLLGTKSRDRSSKKAILQLRSDYNKRDGCLESKRILH